MEAIMLNSLHVKNLALIEEAEIEFDTGLNILTGETGAGKSIILGSIHLALGGKASADIIRKGAEYALTELVFTVKDLDKINQLKEMDIVDLSDGEIVISRKITNTRSPIKVNGITFTASQVKKIAAILIDIHGQHDNQLLLKENSHLDMIDLFGADVIKPVWKKYIALYKEYQKLCDKLENMDMNEEARQREISFLEYEINEITSAQLMEGEDEDLEAAYKKMANAQKIAEELSLASQLLTEGDANAADMVGQAIKAVSTAKEYDEELAEAADNLTAVENLLGDIICFIHDYALNSTFDSMQFEEISSRLDCINSLKLKYGKTISAINSYAKQQQKKLDELNNYADVVHNLKDSIREKKNQLEEFGKKLTELRKDSAKSLCEEISKGLKELNFLNDEFDAAFSLKENFTASGRDDVRFMISTNIGEPLKPLSKVASGGELSRIMLAVKTVMAGKEDTQTLIFDEIDSGISGRTAQMVARKLKSLSENHQIICITHLPQIAAMASSHYMIEKNVTNHHTKTSIAKLDEAESVMELARLLGGSTITETVISNAKEMKKLAKT